MKSKKEEFDWFKWAGIEPSNRDKLLEEARKYKVPVFDNDKDESLFNRLMSVKTFIANQETIKLNKVLAIISFVSAIVSVGTSLL